LLDNFDTELPPVAFASPPSAAADASAPDVEPEDELDVGLLTTDVFIWEFKLGDNVVVTPTFCPTFCAWLFV